MPHALPGVVLALALVACAPSLDWRDVRPEGTTIVTQFPCKPGVHARTVELAGVPVRLMLHVCSAGEATWALAWAEGVEPSRIGDVLQALRQGAAGNVGAAAAAPQAQPVPGETPNPHSGRLRLDGRRPDGSPVSGAVLVATRGTTVVQATVLGSRLDPVAVDNFLGALRLAG